ncbi:hypothetical protein Pcinc_004725 [Petrolisthes cinctipes]|uniref:Secreted protein n=1 Tax=Petrolisthes cinctipes TaxID=88211 RepID=A0AAE1GGI2_PETCI|nr:hypothetical protein Pcinc_004725 [Petrolisthes cinctipes]
MTVSTLLLLLLLALLEFPSRWWRKGRAGQGPFFHTGGGGGGGGGGGATSPCPKEATLSQGEVVSSRQQVGPRPGPEAEDAFVSSLLIGRQPGRCLVIGWLRREKRGHVTRRVARVVRATTSRKALAKDAESPVAGAWVPANSLRQIAATQRFISL